MSEIGVFTFRTLPTSRYESSPPIDHFDRNDLIRRTVGENRSVLELGCSTGFVSKLLKQSGCSVVGVEIDPLAAEAAAKICDRVIVADLSLPDWIDQAKGQFEVILMGDVLEHLVAPDILLKSLTPLLLPGGYVVLSLPNVVHWTQRLKVLAGRFRYQSVGLLDVTHLRFFDLPTARALVTKSGYDVETFHPVIGGRFSNYLRPLWQFLGHCLPNLFGYQFLFKAKPRDTI
jgi:SAM-dependent methyltransferase